jgi:hypothetical protein
MKDKDDRGFALMSADKAKAKAKDGWGRQDELRGRTRRRTAEI